MGFVLWGRDLVPVVYIRKVPLFTVFFFWKKSVEGHEKLAEIDKCPYDKSIRTDRLDTVFFTLSMFAAFKDCKKRCHAPFSRCVNNNRSEEECECIQECPKAMKEVCGSDNVTYDNECLLKKAACEKNTEIKIKEKGFCTGM